MTKIEIPLSKTKLIIGTVGSFLFIVGGFYMLISIDNQRTWLDSILTRGFGIAGIIFFGATGIYSINKMFGKNIGLTIDDYGITDNTNASSIGLIKWTDIKEIKTKQVMSTEFLLIFTDNNEKYLERVSGMKRKLMKANMKKYGTPLSITSNTLKCGFKDLESLINDEFNKQRKKCRTANMQYTKLGFSRLSKGCGSHQVLCSLIDNRSAIPNFAYCHRW